MFVGNALHCLCCQPPHHILWMLRTLVSESPNIPSRTVLPQAIKPRLEVFFLTTMEVDKIVQEDISACLKITWHLPLQELICSGTSSALGIIDFFHTVLVQGGLLSLLSSLVVWQSQPFPSCRSSFCFSCEFLQFLDLLPLNPFPISSLQNFSCTKCISCGFKHIIWVHKHVHLVCFIIVVVLSSVGKKLGFVFVRNQFLVSNMVNQVGEIIWAPIALI